MNSEEIIALLGLEPHPAEGGFFRETFRAREQTEPSVLGPAYGGPRSLGTAIYYLLAEGTCSALHMLPGDEMFHFYLGDPVEMLMLLPDGTSELVVLGPDIAGGMAVQHVVPGGTWQGARLASGGRFALLGTTMSPGFDYADFRSGDARELAARYPERAGMIHALTPR